jgi:hypothetical protein
MAWLKPAAGLGAVLLMAACTGQPVVPPTPTYLTGTLTGTQEVPPTASPGNGNVIATFDQRSRVLTWTVNYAGLTGPLQSAHWHGPAPAGSNAGVAVPIPVTFSPLSGSTVLTDAQAADLLRGLWYVNLHTPAYPNGELRGQVSAAPQGYVTPTGYSQPVYVPPATVPQPLPYPPPPVAPQPR